MARGEIPTYDDEYRPMVGTVYGEVHEERIRAHNLHDSHGGSMERKTWDDLGEWVNVTVEEVGEVSKAINEYHAGNLTAEEFRAELHKEVLQCAAMYTVWLEAFEDEG